MSNKLKERTNSEHKMNKNSESLHEIAHYILKDLIYKIWHHFYQTLIAFQQTTQKKAPFYRLKPNSATMRRKWTVNHSNQTNRKRTKTKSAKRGVLIEIKQTQASSHRAESHAQGSTTPSKNFQLESQPALCEC